MVVRRSRAAGRDPGKNSPLFIIERAKNANAVHYDARITADGKLDAKQPVIAYWVMLAKNGRWEELSWIEKKKAYGFNIKPNPSVNGYKMTVVVSPPQRQIAVKKGGGDAVSVPSWSSAADQPFSRRCTSRPPAG